MSQSESKPGETPEEFMSRWSRRKQLAREEIKAPQPVDGKAVDSETAPTLPKVEDLGMESDYRDFFHPKVEENVRRAALKKLFSDPHFSAIDGLDIYLDDYSITEALPAAMLAELKQAQNILGWAKEDREAEAERERLAAQKDKPALAGDADAVPVAAVPSAPDADADEVVAGRKSPDAGPQSA